MCRQSGGGCAPNRDCQLTDWRAGAAREDVGTVGDGGGWGVIDPPNPPPTQDAPRPEQRAAPYDAQQRIAPKPPAVARERSRASTVTSKLNGQGVALLGNNKRPCCASGAAGGVLHHSEATGGHAETAGGCARA
ncbi:MAG: hypothetical protein LBD24_04940 [Spirochaetaceae bacterium]|nr:hypothetical protein [Spirochaetaceae bacterium]